MVIQRQLGHSNLGITSVYLQGIDNTEIIETVHAPPDDPGQRSLAPLTTETESPAAARRAKHKRR
jgi:hypothetical protein